jgi:hypothetical protein
LSLLPRRGIIKITVTIFLILNTHHANKVLEFGCYYYTPPGWVGQFKPASYHGLKPVAIAVEALRAIGPQQIKFPFHSRPSKSVLAKVFMGHNPIFIRAS